MSESQPPAANHNHQPPDEFLEALNQAIAERDRISSRIEDRRTEIEHIKKTVEAEMNLLGNLLASAQVGLAASDTVDSNLQKTVDEMLAKMNMLDKKMAQLLKAADVALIYLETKLLKQEELIAELSGEHRD